MNNTEPRAMHVEAFYVPHSTGVYRVLIGNDRWPGETADAWKYKIVAPYSVWSLGFDTEEQAREAARADVRDNYDDAPHDNRYLDTFAKVMPSLGENDGTYD